MGWCQEFGSVIAEGCDHAMVAGTNTCSCPTCGVVCPGKFEACSDVWASGAAAVELRPAPPRLALDDPVPAPVEPLVQSSRSGLGPANGSSAAVANGSLPAEAVPDAGPSLVHSLATLNQGMERLHEDVVSGRVDPNANLTTQGTTEALHQLLHGLPERISALLVDTTEAQREDLFAAGDRMTRVLAKRVVAEIQALEASRSLDVAPAVDALTDLVTQQQRQIETLQRENRQLVDARVPGDDVAPRQQAIEALEALSSRLENQSERLQRQVDSIEKRLDAAWNVLDGRLAGGPLEAVRFPSVE